MTYWIKWEILEVKQKETVCIHYHLNSDNFLMYSRTLRKNGCCSDLIISSAAESCGRKWLRVAGNSEKTAPWWNQVVKEAIRAKNDVFKVLLRDRSSSDLQSWYTEWKKAATSAVKKSKKSWKELGRWLDSNYFSANKVF